MAVRPTDGRSLTGSVATRLYYVTAALAAVSVVCVITLGYLYVDRTDSSASAATRAGDLFRGTSQAQQQAQDVQTQREAARTVGEQFILRLNTYGPHDLDKQNLMPDYIARVHALMSAKLQTSFDQGVELAEKSVAQTGLARVASVTSSAVSSIDADHATVLVAGTIAQSYPDPQAPKDTSKRIKYQPDPVRASLAMVMDGGSWKVDNFCFVVGDPGSASCTDGVESTTTPDSGTTGQSGTGGTGGTGGAGGAGNPGAGASGGSGRSTGTGGSATTGAGR